MACGAGAETAPQAPCREAAEDGRFGEPRAKYARVFESHRFRPRNKKMASRRGGHFLYFLAETRRLRRPAAKRQKMGDSESPARVRAGLRISPFPSEK